MANKNSDEKVRALAVQGNDLVNARFQMNMHQVRMFIAILSRIKREDTAFREMQIPIKEIITNDSGAAYEQVRDACRGLLSKYIEVEDVNAQGKQRYIGIPLMSICQFVAGSGFVNVLLNQKIEPYLLQLTSNFTKAEIDQLRKLHSPYAFRIYWLMKQYLKIGERRLSVVELRRILYLENKYRSFSALRQRILEPAQKQLEKTDIQFTFQPIRKGRSVEAIHFNIFSSRRLKTMDRGAQAPALIEKRYQGWEYKLHSNGVAHYSIRQIRNEVDAGEIDAGYVEYCIEKVQLRKIEGKAESIGGLLYTSIVDRYWWDEYLQSKQASQTSKRALSASVSQKQTQGRIPPEQVLAEAGLTEEQIAWILMRHSAQTIYRTTYQIRVNQPPASSLKDLIWKTFKAMKPE